MPSLRRLVPFLIACVALLPIDGVAQQTLRAVAVVNDSVISDLDLEMRTRLLMLSSGIPENEENRQRLQPEVLRALIDETLQQQEATRLAIEADQAAVQETFANIAAGNALTPERLAKILTDNGVLPEYLLDQIRAQLLWQRVLQLRIAPQVVVTEADIDRAVAQLEATSGQPQVRINEIFLPIENATEAASVRNLADNIYRALQQGASFPAIARQFSRASSAAQGGDRGWVNATELVDEVEAALALAAPGQVLPPIETLNGVWIVSFRETRATPESDVTVGLRQLLEPVAGADVGALNAAARRLRDVVSGVTSCADAERAATANGMLSTFDLGARSLDDLAPNVRNAVAALPIGKPSDPVQVPGGIAVMVVCERTEVGISREKVRLRLQNEQLEVLARRYMRDLRRAATVELRI